ncbi:MAG: MaoC/PaaZ C-terminal domain-containing protein [Gemmatimonadota bacterium]|nr:MaoC family dehydratase N-terminal domain-containing protein [Gemmatimonadota bacterium]
MAIERIDDVEVGADYTEQRTFDRALMETFIAFTRDSAGIHTDASHSAGMGFEDLVVHGFLLSTPFSRILGMELPGERTVIGSMELNFHEPVYKGDTVTYTATVTRVIRPLRSVLLDLRIVKSDGTVCVKGKANCVFK